MQMCTPGNLPNSGLQRDERSWAIQRVRGFIELNVQMIVFLIDRAKTEPKARGLMLRKVVPGAIFDGTRFLRERRRCEEDHMISSLTWAGIQKQSDPFRETILRIVVDLGTKISFCTGG